MTPTTPVLPRIIIINGASTGSTDHGVATVRGFRESGFHGEIDVTVESSVFAAFRIVVFLDDEANEQLDLNSDNEPTETFGLSGLITVLAPEAWKTIRSLFFRHRRKRDCDCAGSWK